MGGAGSSAFPGPIGRYLSGLCVAGLGLCAAGWLVLTPFAFGYGGRGWHDAALTNLATGGGLAAACLITLVVWAVAWRHALRADGVLTSPPRGQARRQARAQRRRERDHVGAGAADPAQVLTALRALLAPLLDPSADPAGPGSPSAAGPVYPMMAAGVGEHVIPGPRSAPEEPEVMPGQPEGIAAIQSMLAGAELLMTGCEEEAW